MYYPLLYSYAYEVFEHFITFKLLVENIFSSKIKAWKQMWEGNIPGGRFRIALGNVGFHNSQVTLVNYKHTLHCKL